MKRMQTGVIGWGVLWAWLLAGLVAGSTGQAATYEDIVIDELATPRPLVHYHGYVEYRFRIVNNSTDTPHVVTLRMPGRSMGGQLSLQRSVSVPPQVEAQISLWKPAGPMHGGSAGVWIDGKLQESDVPVDMVRDGSDTMQYIHYRSSQYPRSILVSQRVPAAGRDHLESLATQAMNAAAASSGVTSSSPSYSSSTTTDFNLQRTSLPLSQWSESWLSYTAFDGVILTQEDLRAMPSSVSQALLAYVELGGNLLVVGDGQLPAMWKGWERTSPAQSPMTFNAVGLGQAAMIAQSQLTAMTLEQFKALDQQMWNASFTRHNQMMDVAAANAAFPVVDNLGVPARSMLAIMMLFALLIGPANMVFFAYLDKRLWTLVTIPVLAVVFSAGVFLFTILADGIWAEGRATTLTLLDQDAGRATTIGWLGYYAPLQPSDGLTFDTHTALNLQNQSTDYRSYSSGSQSANARTIDWTTNQHLQTGWITSRIPAHFTLRKSQTRRERLVVTQDAQGNITVVNGLGSDITDLKLCDPNGGLHFASQPIAAGQRHTLTRTDFKPGIGGDLRYMVLSANWQEDPQAL